MSTGRPWGLRGTVSGKPLLLPARHFLNLAMLVSSVTLAVLYAKDGHTWALEIVPFEGGSQLGRKLERGVGRFDLLRLSHFQRRQPGVLDTVELVVCDGEIDLRGLVAGNVIDAAECGNAQLIDRAGV